MIEVLIISNNGNHMITYTCTESTCHTPDIYTALCVICISIKMFKGTKTWSSLIALPLVPPMPLPQAGPQLRICPSRSESSIDRILSRLPCL